MRLQSYVKNYGNFTKSEVIKLQNQNRILVNNEFNLLSYNLKEEDVVTIDNKVLERIPYVYYLFNKPKGIICTNDIKKDNNIKSYLNIKERVYSIGRLDKDSHGLLILTNDNNFCHYVLENMEKEYVVRVKNIITNEFLDGIENGVLIRGKMTKKCVIKKINDYTFSIILKEGMYHQIRKMVIANHNTVVDLERIRIGNITLDACKGELTKIDNIKDIL